MPAAAAPLTPSGGVRDWQTPGFGIGCVNLRPKQLQHDVYGVDTAGKGLDVSLRKLAPGNQFAALLNQACNGVGSFHATYGKEFCV